MSGIIPKQRFTLMIWSIEFVYTRRKKLGNKYAIWIDPVGDVVFDPASKIKLTQWMQHKLIVFFCWLYVRNHDTVPVSGDKGETVAQYSHTSHVINHKTVHHMPHTIIDLPHGM